MDLIAASVPDPGTADESFRKRSTASPTLLQASQTLSAQNTSSKSQATQFSQSSSSEHQRSSPQDPPQPSSQPMSAVQASWRLIGTGASNRRDWLNQLLSHAKRPLSTFLHASVRSFACYFFTRSIKQRKERPHVCALSGADAT